MKIRINKFCFFVPLSSRIVRFIMKKYVTEYLQVLDSIIFSLKEYKRVNGHFNLIEVEDKDGNRVVITI